MTKKPEDTTILVRLYTLLDQGFNLIPVYQADDPRINTNGVPVAKTPCVSWKQYKTEPTTKKQITTWYKQFPGCAWAVLCGAASNDLFVVDFDDPSIYESHFIEWSKRTFVVQTPSGGYHAYFRISPCPANTNKYKAMYDIDTRGEGGYVLAPIVSKGYTIISKTEKIAQMTDLDREIDVWEKLDIQDDYYDLARIRSGVSVMDIVRHYGDNNGAPIHNNSKIRCPFHDDKSPSMSLHPHRFKCFGCDAQGSALDYVMLKLQIHDVTLAAKAIEKITHTEYRMSAPPQAAATVGQPALSTIDPSELTGDWDRREMRIDIQPEGFISKYIQYAKTLSFAYDEYHYCGALMLLSTLAMRRRHVRFAHKTYYPLLYMFLLGPSTVSMKSMAMNLVREIMEEVDWGDDTLLPNSFTPEALYELMNANNQRSLINDEAGAFLKNMKKPYMRDMQDMLCQIFDEKSMRRKLRTSKDGDSNSFSIPDPFLNILFATVPTTVQDVADTSDVDSGWFVRFLFSYPRYDKEISRDKWFRLEKEDDVFNRGEVVDDLKTIDTWLNNTAGQSIDLEDDALSRLRSWRADLDEEIRHRDNELYGTIMGRLSDYIVKLSMLHAVSRMSDTISLSDLDQSIDVVENFFLHTAEEVFGAVEETSTDYAVKRYGSITRYLKKHRGQATHREIMRQVHLKSKEVAELMDTMLLSGEVRTGDRKNRNGTTTVVYYLQQ